MRRRMPSLAALRSFEAAARHENFTLAAQELLVTHAAISRQVRRLEEELAVRLFDRTGNRVSLNGAGRDLLAILSRAFDGIAAATNRLSVGRQANRLVLSVDPGLAARWLNARLSRFHRIQPEVDVEIIPSLELAAFPNDLIDAAIHYAFEDPPSELQWIRLISLEAFPVCSPRLVEDGPGLRAPADLARHRLLHEQNTTWWRRWLTLVGEHRIDWSKGPIYHDSSLVLDAAAASQGVAIGDNLLAFEQLDDGRLVKPFAATCPSGSYYLVMPELDQPVLRRFETWLVEEFAIQAAESARWAAAKPSPAHARKAR
ncbi:MAG: LysR substrate-binding domain-containing protein [Dongiaceae bacterium]